jgi:uncharacterized protein (UPF0218 family)
VISVGDVVTASIASNNMKPFLAVVDMKTRRSDISLKPVLRLLKECKVHRIRNPPGKLSLEAIDLVCKLLEHPDPSGCHVLIVDGEEDMLALPALSCAPIGSVVLYGVPGVGVAAFFVDQSVRYLSLIHI